MPDELDAMWGQVVADWDNGEAHRRFIGYCQATEQLAAAATHYRNMEKDNPKRAGRAREQLDQILSLAMAQLAHMPRSEASKPFRAPLVIASMLFLGVVVLSAVWAWLRFR